MDVMQSRNVHIPRAGSEHLHSIRRHQQCLASGSLSIFRTTGVSCSLRHSLQGRRLLLSEDTSFPTLEIRSCAHGHRPPSAHNTGFPATSVNKFKCAVDDDQNLLLKERGRVIAPHLKGRCIYLVGMMGSGKTTVGKLIADALGYQFTDSDKVIEDDNGVSVAEFFRLQNEMSFRDAETRVLEKLSHNLQQVISTGGGIVVRPENWKYMRYGLTVWLDVPLEALAERVVAVGTHSRPLLGGELDSESAYSKALARLISIFEVRESCYAKADARVSLKKLAIDLGYEVRDITPTLIALQALEEIDRVLTKQNKEQKEE